MAAFPKKTGNRKEQRPPCESKLATVS